MKLIFLYLMLFLLPACSTPDRNFVPADLIIPIDKPIEKAPSVLSDLQVKADVSYLIYALDRGYAGYDYLPAGAFAQMIKRHKQISGAMSPEVLRDMIDSALLEVPDSHLHAQFNNKLSKLREGQQLEGNVGNNFYAGSNKHPWKIEIRKINKKKVLFISISSFPFHESSVWSGFLEQVRKDLNIVTDTVIDLRGNGGGDDTIGMQLAWTFFGKNFRYPLAIEHERTTAEAQAIYMNMFGYEIAKNLSSGKVSDEFLLNRYKSRQLKYNAAISSNADSYVNYNKSVYEYQSKPINTSVIMPVYILMDRKCASSCESTIDAFEFYPTVKKIGENTAGYIHFGNVSPIILPNSKIMVQIATHFAEYYDKRYLEKVGIKPDLLVPAGHDALEFTLQLIKK